ncbi:MAG: AmmeMemoRadiSam system protein A [Candidatus Atribacteria bacterium]|nr:AmmeMemoRadiSam system protein A [Candidatus Atribacteria bacterium]MCD6349965.1 AmmeMemoRadiSam system protein A [Candidatus Atribacteria bacterium]
MSAYHRRDPKFGKDITDLAYRSIAYFLEKGSIVPLPRDIHPDLLTERRGVFVSLKKNGRLRGCMGTFVPQQENLALEVIHNALAAAFEDPRFPPVRPEELALLSISVDVLSPPEPVENIEELDPRKFGIIVESGFRKGLLLPDIEGVDTVEEQIRIAKAKAGIAPREPVKIYRFTVERFYRNDYL